MPFYYKRVLHHYPPGIWTFILTMDGLEIVEAEDEKDAEKKFLLVQEGMDKERFDLSVFDAHGPHQTEKEAKEDFIKIVERQMKEKSDSYKKK